MATQHIYCLHVIVPEADRDGANEMAAQASPDYAGAFADANTSAGGAFPPTHIYLSARITEQERSAFSAELADWQNHGLSAQPAYWLIRAADGVLLGSNVSAGSVGQPWGVSEQATFAAAELAWTAFPEE